MSERMRRRLYNNKNVHFFALLLAIISLGLSGNALAGEDTSAHPTWPGPGQLFVGTCYQPIDRSPEQIDQDIAIMKHAGFNVVRMGDLSWDSFEPSQGKFTFVCEHDRRKENRASGGQQAGNTDQPGL